MDIGLLLTILGLIVTIVAMIFSGYIHEKWITPHRFYAKGGRKIAGEYYCVAYSQDAMDRSKPITWEEGVITQIGKKVHYTNSNSDLGYSYEFLGEIYDDFIHGYWESKIETENVKGTAILYISKRGHMAGMWVGDSKNSVSWGYWALSKKRAILENFIHKMQIKIKFKADKLDQLLEDVE